MIQNRRVRLTAHANACLVACLVPFLVGACTSRSRAGEPPPAAPGLADIQAGPAVVVGTVIDAATGRPSPGAVVTGPGGAEAVSDASGRFRIKGMAPGTQGELRAVAGARSGSVRLRPLAGGVLEVVVYLN
jgi:hypothetical protein